MAQKHVDLVDPDSDPEHLFPDPDSDPTSDLTEQGVIWVAQGVYECNMSLKANVTTLRLIVD
jgi:hypothetical protein